MKLIVIALFYSQALYATFHHKLDELVSSAISIQYQNEMLWEQKKRSTPNLVWLDLLEIETINQDLNKQIFCLHLFTGSGKKKKLLRLTYKKEKSCFNQYDGPLVSEVAVVDEIRLKKGNPIEIFYNKSNHRYFYYNQKKLSDHKIFDSFSQYKNGLFAANTTKLLSDVDERLENGFRCIEYDKHCQLKAPDRCHLCKSGLYKVVGSECPTKSNVICGPLKCGKKNQHACVRGFRWNNKKFSLEQKCYQSSQSGFCQKGLVTFCNSNGELVCL